MDDIDIPITEKTRINLPFQGWSQVVVIVSVVVWAYFSLRADVTASIDQSKENALGLQQQRATIQEMRMDVQAIKDNVGWFRQQYERDMSRYVRERTDSAGK